MRDLMYTKPDEGLNYIVVGKGKGNTATQGGTNILVTPNSPFLFDVPHCQIEGTDDLLNRLCGPTQSVLRL